MARQKKRDTDNLRITYDLHGRKVIFTVEIPIENMKEVIKAIKNDTFDCFIANIGFKKKRSEENGK